MVESGRDQPGQRRIDFSRLRNDVEAATTLPQFDHVARRARRRRARTRLATMGTLALIAGVLGSVGVVAQLRQSGPQGIVSGPGLAVEPSVNSSASPSVQVHIAAAAGIDLNHMYALVDVCVVDSCNLQLSRLSGGSTKPVRTNLLRNSPTAWLDSIGLTALSDTSFVVSGLTDTGHWQYAQVDLGSDDSRAGYTQGPSVTTSDRPVQLTRHGPIQAVQVHSGQLLDLPSQPPLAQPSVVESVAPDKGIWVTGVASNAQLAVSVSRNAGRTWTTQPLGIMDSALSTYDEPVFATHDGKSAYLLARLATEDFALFATSDGGRTWHREPAAPPWPEPVPVGAPYGMVVRPDGSLLTWLATSPTVTYLESTDAGAQFRVTSTGPGGRVFAVPDGYVQLGAQAAVSRDAATWAPTQVPYAVPGG